MVAPLFSALGWLLPGLTQATSAVTATLIWVSSPSPATLPAHGERVAGAGDGGRADEVRAAGECGYGRQRQHGQREWPQR